MSHDRIKQPSYSEHTDVVIVGGGPAGTATALSLARAGRKVVVLDRSRYDSVRVGETLAPSVLPLLSSLSLSERFMRQSPIASPGIVSVWDSDEPYDNDFIWHPCGNGWHIDRSRFDRMIADAAEEAGAKVYQAARVERCYRDESGRWQLEALTDSMRIQLSAGFLVEATGRNSPPIGQTLSGRVFYDRLVGVITFLTIPAADNLRDTRTLVEASENGWWYSSPLPGSRFIIAYMSDSEIVKYSHATSIEGWQRLIRQAPYTWERVTDYIRDVKLRVVAANTYRRKCISGTNHLIIGDAAVAYDPLSGQGIQKALETGLVVAYSLSERLEGNLDAIREYERWVDMNFANYLRERTDYYRRVTRWPQSPFWQSRRSAIVANRSMQLV